ncbi:hypothetical protein GGP48_002549 [Salinibacter ruber]|nr:hypothetical protein [Salinibacter ruber]
MDQKSKTKLRLPADSQSLWFRYVWIFSVLIVVIGGIRFSDGSALLAIAQGATAESPLFSGSGALQYIWDSPLKVLSLRYVPPNIYGIGLFFGFLSVLPVALLLTRDTLLFWLSSSALILTPCLKISMQNIGVGDGLTIFLAILLCYLNNNILISLSSFVLGLWHPHQSFFIGISFVLSKYVFFEDIEWRQVATVLASLALAAAVFFLWKASLGFEYSGRGTFMQDRMPELLYKNLVYAPVAFLPIALWFWFIPVAPRRGKCLLGGWLFILGIVSLLTTDVTRVISLTALPILLAESKKIIIEERDDIPVRRILVFASLIVLIPPFSWSGLDYLVWTDLFSDLCEWGVYCL